MPFGKRKCFCKELKGCRWCNFNNPCPRPPDPPVIGIKSQDISRCLKEINKQAGKVSAATSTSSTSIQPTDGACSAAGKSTPDQEVGHKPLLDFDRKIRHLMQLTKSSSGASQSNIAQDSTSGYFGSCDGQQPQQRKQQEKRTQLQRLATQSFRTARNIQQQIHLNNMYIDDYPLFEALGHINDAEEFHKFEGALRAAELATKNAPPEDVEEAAVKGARAYQAQITETVALGGEKNLVEVVGYIGITR